MYAPIGSPDFVRISQALDLAIKTDLQNLRDWYFDCLLVCTGVVGLGVFMEGFEIFHDMWGIFRGKSIELKYWMTPSIDRKKYRPPDWMKLLAGVGWVLIVLGIAGEGVYEGLVSKYDGALSTLNDTLIAETQKETALALAQAVHAETTARGFDVQISTALQITAEAKKEAESERLARVKLQKELEPRRLTVAQKEKLVSLLRDRPEPIAIMWAMDGTEAVDFANDIGDALNKAGWKTTFGVRTTFEHGIEVGTMQGSDSPLVMAEIERLK
jgi:hypothetical protein